MQIQIDFGSARSGVVLCGKINKVSLALLFASLLLFCSAGAYEISMNPGLQKASMQA
jgi:hypothetical protein